MRTYTELTDELTGNKVIQYEEGDKIGWIPCDPANTDYQAYLEHEAKAK
jgi:hypothetical protein